VKSETPQLKTKSSSPYIPITQDNLPTKLEKTNAIGPLLMPPIFNNQTSVKWRIGKAFGSMELKEQY
jgi:hypothetical protein